MVGALIFGPLSDRFGRLKAMFSALVGFAAMTLSSSFAMSYAAYSALRFFSGVFCGATILVSTIPIAMRVFVPS